ncbi:MAG: cupin domain-containing protein [Acidimicrobiales bacterium]
MDLAAVVTDDRTLLASIVGDDEDFLATTFGRRPWHRASSAAAVPFDLDDLDAMVASGIRVPAIRMVRAGERVPPGEFCSPTRIGSTTLADTADARKVLDLHRRGATLVVQSLQRTFPTMVRWCCELEEQVGWPVQANAYLTPPHQRGLDRHADGHDVLVLQLHGAKRWWVDGLGDLLLRADEVLYLPAGTEHVAETGDEPSLHLTIGIHRPSPERIARAALDLAQERMPTEGATDEERLSRVAVELGRVGTDEAIDRLRRPPRTSPLGELARSVRRPEVGLATVLRPAAPWSVDLPARAADGDDARVGLGWGHRRLSLPHRALAALERLGGAAPAGVAVAELPGLDDRERLVLARRLLDEGALELVPPPPPPGP